MNAPHCIVKGWTEAWNLPDSDYVTAQNDLTLRVMRTGEKVYAYEEGDEGQLLVPRYYAYHRFPGDLYETEVRTKLGATIEGTWTGQLRPGQKTLVEQAIPRLMNHLGGQFIAQCGFGKLIVGVYLAANVLKRRCAVLVEKEILLDQWLEGIKKVTNCSVGVVQADQRELDRDFVVMMAQTLRSRPLEPHEQGTFGTLLVDELHHFSAPTLSACITQFPAQYRVGLTATDERGDGLTPIFAWHVGPVLVRQDEWELKPVIYRVDTGVSIGYDLDKRPHPREVIVTQVEAADRDVVILSAATRAVDAGRWPLVLSDRIEHLVRLREQYDGDAAVLVGTGKHKTKRKDRDRVKEARVLFATYGTGGEGFDDEKRDTLIAATTRQNNIQPPGRITRPLPGKKEPLVLDLVDKGSYFERAWRSRKRKYERMGWRIEHGNV